MEYESSDTKKFIEKNIFSKTGEAFFDFSIEMDELYSELSFIGNKLCKDYIGKDSSFYILESVQIQAVAIHEYKCILVYRGMLEFIFRISAMMIGSQRRVNSKDEHFYEPWRENIRDWLDGGELDWEDENYWWVHDEPHRIVFDSLVEGLFIFVVLHEIGHIHNLHGERRHDNNKTKSFIHKVVDSYEESDDFDRISAHAREIVADTYAFQFLLAEIKGRLFSKSIYPDVDEDGLSLGNYIYCIYLAASFFWAMSIKRPMKNNEQKDGYPSHVFRLTSIEAASLEHRVCRGIKKLTEGAVSLGMNNYIEKSLSASGDDNIIRWRETMNIPANQEHYEKICKVTNEWANLKFGVRDEDWIPVSPKC